MCAPVFNPYLCVLIDAFRRVAHFSASFTAVVCILAGQARIQNPALRFLSLAESQRVESESSQWCTTAVTPLRALSHVPLLLASYHTARADAPPVPTLPAAGVTSQIPISVTSANADGLVNEATVAVSSRGGLDSEIRQLTVPLSPTVSPTGIYLLENFRTSETEFATFDSRHRRAAPVHKENRLVTVSDIMVTTLFLPASSSDRWLTLWVTNAHQVQVPTDLRASVTMYAVCPHAGAATRHDVTKLFERSTSTQGLVSFLLSTLAHECPLGSSLRLVAVANHESQFVVVPINTWNLVSYTAPASSPFAFVKLFPSSAASAAATATDSTLASHDEDADCIDVGVVTTDAGVYHVGATFAVKGYIRVQRGLELVLPRSRFRYRLHITFQRLVSMHDTYTDEDRTTTRPDSTHVALDVDDMFGSFDDMLTLPQDVLPGSAVTLRYQTHKDRVCCDSNSCRSTLLFV
jgi:hypothetical protein